MTQTNLHSCWARLTAQLRQVDCGAAVTWGVLLCQRGRTVDRLERMAAGRQRPSQPRVRKSGKKKKGEKKKKKKKIQIRRLDQLTPKKGRLNPPAASCLGRRLPVDRPTF